jgi:predicted flap endonuclease-1-like 5' DNA nuclease
METNALIAILLDVGVAIFFVYALYTTSQNVKKKPASTTPPEPKPQSVPVEAPKPEPVKLVSEPKPVSVPVEAKQEEVKPVEPAKPEPSPSKTEAKPKKTPQASEKKERGFNVIDIEGIGKVYAEKLHKINIYTTAELLEAGATPHGRRELSAKTGISHEQILDWVNLSDLFRVKGIGEEYSDLLEEAGVDTVVELAHRNAEHLHAKILEVNEAKKLVRRPPPLSSIEAWIEEAKSLPRVVEY